VIVDADANVEAAARRIAFGKFLNGSDVHRSRLRARRRARHEGSSSRSGAIRDFYGPIPLPAPDYARIVNDAHFRRLEHCSPVVHRPSGSETRAEDAIVARPSCATSPRLPRHDGGDLRPDSPGRARY
jgi:aldehyde dehydrogenase (NAD+)